MGITFVHTGDVHIGSPFRGLPIQIRSTRRNEIIRTFLNILKYAKEKKVDFLLIAGDLFENDYVTVNELHQINNGFIELEGTHVCLIAGNHDPIVSEKSFYKRMTWASNVHIFTRDIEYIYFEDKGTTIYGHSWHEKFVHVDVLQKIDKQNHNGYHILLAHGDAYTNSSYLPIHIPQLEEKAYDYVALGHIHRPDFISERLAYCGSPEPLNYGEEHDHGFIYGQIDHHSINTKFIPINQRNYKKVDVTIKSKSFEAEIIQEIMKHVNDRDLFNIILKGETDWKHSIDINYIQEKVNEKTFYTQIIDQRDTFLDIDSMEKEHQQDIIGAFIKRMKEEGLMEPINKRALEIGLELLLEEKGVEL